MSLLPSTFVCLSCTVWEYVRILFFGLRLSLVFFFVFFLVETFFFCLPLSLSNSYVSDFSTLAQHLLEGLCCHCQHLTWLMWVGDTCSHSINEWLPICWYQHNSRYCRYANIHQVNYLSIWSFIRVSLGQGGSFYLQLSSLSPPCPLYLIALSQ